MLPLDHCAARTMLALWGFCKHRGQQSNEKEIQFSMTQQQVLAQASRV